MAEVQVGPTCSKTAVEKFMLEQQLGRSALKPPGMFRQSEEAVIIPQIESLTGVIIEASYRDS